MALEVIELAHLDTICLRKKTIYARHCFCKHYNFTLTAWQGRMATLKLERARKIVHCMTTLPPWTWDFTYFCWVLAHICSSFLRPKPCYPRVGEKVSARLNLVCWRDNLLNAMYYGKRGGEGWCDESLHFPSLGGDTSCLRGVESFLGLHSTNSPSKNWEKEGQARFSNRFRNSRLWRRRWSV